MKKLAKKAVAALLGYQVRSLYKKNQFKVIAVAGSIGKTSTKLAIANTLKAGFRVCYQEGNYNDIVTVPLVFFGEEKPSIFNPFSWLAVFWRSQRRVSQPYPYDVVVVELGSDGPGQIQEFNKYLKVEIGVITSVSPEHMQFFESLDRVAKEELSLSGFSSLILANKDLCDEKYLKNVNELLTYSIKDEASYNLKLVDNRISVTAGKEVVLESDTQVLSEPELYSQLAAIAVAYKLGMVPDAIRHGLKNIKPVAGRMQKLAGINGSTIIDDTYNASPEAVKLALNSLYEMKAPQKIAILGNMNELGTYSETAHKEIGQLCDPKQLNLVVTIGQDANRFLAPAAEAGGCQVQKFDSPYKAAEYVKPLIKNGALILAKGSQNGVFAEEAVKQLLANPQHSSKLVRQSAEWQKIKQKAFKV